MVTARWGRLWLAHKAKMCGRCSERAYEVLSEYAYYELDIVVDVPWFNKHVEQLEQDYREPEGEDDESDAFGDF